ncbi:MAG: hypothetical protein IPK80_28315 [Nannocystis sp.]|nr:hypothetical protein [Nannocystis sp.]
MDEDALGERGVLLEAQAPAQGGVADEPEGEVVAAVEVEATEAVELVEELVAESLSFVEDDDGDDPALVDEGDERAFDVGDDLRLFGNSSGKKSGLAARGRNRAYSSA